ncbi:MAG: single-stranded DNA-binding protein [Saprospiraceae bacterium]
MKTIINKVSLTGRLGKDPLIKLFDNGNRKASLFLAVHESFLNQSGRKINITQWHRITAWGRTADQVEKMLHKGSKISLHGNLRYFEIQDKELKYRSFQEITIDEFEVHLEVNQIEMLRA